MGTASFEIFMATLFKEILGWTYEGISKFFGSKGTSILMKLRKISLTYLTNLAAT